MRRSIILVASIWMLGMVVWPAPGASAASVIHIGGRSGSVKGLSGTFLYTPPNDGALNVAATSPSSGGQQSITVYEKGPQGTWQLIVSSGVGSEETVASSGVVMVRKHRTIRIDFLGNNDVTLSWQLSSDPCTVVGTPGNDVLQGTKGKDVVCGLGGDDTYVATNGNDTFFGGSGSDTVSFVNAPTGIKAKMLSHWPEEAQTSGDASVTGWGKYTLLNVENVTGSSFDDRIVGSDVYPSQSGGDPGPYDSSNVFIGGPGNDVLLGGGDEDALYGWSGDDVLDPGSSACEGGCLDYPYNTSIVDGGKGVDTLTESGMKGWSPPCSLQVNLLQQSAFVCGDTSQVVSVVGIENVMGTPTSDVIRGDAGPNSLWGGGGNDSLYGYNGDDHLYGGTGTNSLDGGKGTDTCDLTGGTGTTFQCEA